MHEKIGGCDENTRAILCLLACCDFCDFCGSWYPFVVMRVLGIILVAIIGVGLLGPTARFG
jgi:hypothetical protein